jgi:hypothetical protein
MSQTFPVVRCKKCLNESSKQWVQRNYLHALATWTKKRDGTTEVTEDFLKDLLAKQGGCCALTGVLFNESYKPSVDRVNSSIGYRKDNIQLVLSEINRMKTNLPLDVFLIRCKQVAEYAVDSTAS